MIDSAFHSSHHGFVAAQSDGTPSPPMGTDFLPTYLQTLGLVLCLTVSANRAEDFLFLLRPAVCSDIALGRGLFPLTFSAFGLLWQKAAAAFQGQVTFS